MRAQAGGRQTPSMQRCSTTLTPAGCCTFVL
jgi:hypothetical protein